MKTLYMGKKPSFVPKNKIVTKKEMRHYNYLNSYINPIVKAKEYLKLLKKERLTQAELAKRLGVSRVRITQFLNLLKLPKEKQNYILKYGKERLITERAIRKGVISARGVQKL
jgi:ParB/RepB/Spo0J family partition protein